MLEDVALKSMPSVTAAELELTQDDGSQNHAVAYLSGINGGMMGQCMVCLRVPWIQWPGATRLHRHAAADQLSQMMLRIQPSWQYPHHHL